MESHENSSSQRRHRQGWSNAYVELSVLIRFRQLYPPGHVYVIESHPVFVYEDETAQLSTKQIRKEGRRVILRYSEDVSVRFSEPVSVVLCLLLISTELRYRSSREVCSWITAHLDTSQPLIPLRKPFYLKHCKSKLRQSAFVVAI